MTVDEDGSIPLGIELVRSLGVVRVDTLTLFDVVDDVGFCFFRPLLLRLDFTA